MSREEEPARRWKLAGLNVRAGLGTKRRDLGDSDTFIVRDTEVRDKLKIACNSSFLFAGSINT